MTDNDDTLTPSSDIKPPDEPDRQTLFEPLKVVPLQAAEPEVDPQMVDLMRQWLQLAKDGDMDMVCIVGVGELGIRWGSAGDQLRSPKGQLMMASVLEQHALGLRMEVFHASEEASDVEVDESDDDEEVDAEAEALKERDWSEIS